MILESNNSLKMSLSNRDSLLYNNFGDDMETKILKKEDLDVVIEILDQDGVVAFPTDTVFGVGVRCDRIQAIEKLKTAKGRPDEKPFPMMVSSVDQMKKVAQVTKRDEKIIEAFMPGALTLIFNKKEEVDPRITNGFDTIAIRMPDDPFILGLLDRLDVPMLVTSANLSGAPSALNDEEAFEQLGGRIEAIVQGKSGAAKASTILDVTKAELQVLRPGELSLEEIEEVL